MNRFILTAAVTGLAAAALANNLFPRGDFDTALETLRGDVISNSGEVSLFVEDANWNRCGMLKIVRALTNADDSVVMSACAFVGGDGKDIGIPVKGDTLYDFSFEVRSETVNEIGVKFQDWKTGVWAKDSKAGNTSLGKVFVRPGWARYRGTFRTHRDAVRAVLMLQLWQSTKYPPVTLRVGDNVLFDNVVIKEAKDLSKAILSGKKKVGAFSSVERKKAVRSGVEFGDFRRLAANKGAVRPLGGVTKVVMETKSDAFEVRIKCEEPLKVRPGKRGALWSGDTLEIYFGPVQANPDRTMTQFAWNPAGDRMAYKSGEEMPQWASLWEVSTKASEKEYESVVRIPFRLLGYRKAPDPGETIALNVCRTRSAAKEWGCWAPVKDMFNEVNRFGIFVFGSWNDALAVGWKASDVKVSTREEFELAVQKLEIARRDSKFEKFKDRPFTVARVSSTSDFGCPFVPQEAFEDLGKIEVKAAVNEVTGVPVAILNLTDRTEEYVVRLENDTSEPGEEWKTGCNGVFGLKGLEKERITLRRALRFKDTEQDPCTVRLDPLPCAGDILSVSVPPKEAGVVWVDFDLGDARAGTYSGRLRVMPLGESASYKPVKGYHSRLYKGKMQDVPFTLEVRPIVLSKTATRPGGFFQSPINRKHAKLMVDAGATEFQVSPWDIIYAHDPKTGEIDLSRPTPRTLKAIEAVREQIAWAKEFGVERPTFFVGFGCYLAAMNKYGRPGLTLEEKAKRFASYVTAVRRFMECAGLKPEDYNLETFDEPGPKLAQEIFAAHKAAKAAVPEVNLTLTMGYVRTDISFFRKMADLTDSWVLWDGYYFQQKENLDFNAVQMSKGKKVWHYTCSTSPRTPLYREYRLHAWFGACYRLSGNQIFWFSDNMGGMGQPDFKVITFGALAYRNFDTYIPSIRYMNLRQSVQDIKYLDKLREVAGEQAEVKAFLDSAPTRVMVEERHDPTAADRMREEAARLILKYQHLQNKRK